MATKGRFFAKRIMKDMGARRYIHPWILLTEFLFAEFLLSRFSPYVTYNEAISPICLPGPDERPNDPNTQCYATGELYLPRELSKV